jgi:hypothetical protein
MEYALSAWWRREKMSLNPERFQCLVGLAAASVRSAGKVPRARAAHYAAEFLKAGKI